MQVAALECGELGAQICGAQLAIGQVGFERGLLLEFERKLLVFGFGRTRVRRLQSHSHCLGVLTAMSVRAFESGDAARPRKHTQIVRCGRRPPGPVGKRSFQNWKYPRSRGAASRWRANLSLRNIGESQAIHVDRRGDALQSCSFNDSAGGKPCRKRWNSTRGAWPASWRVTTR